MAKTNQQVARHTHKHTKRRGYESDIPQTIKSYIASRRSVNACYYTVVSLEGFWLGSWLASTKVIGTSLSWAMLTKCELFLGFYLLVSHLLHLTGKDNFWLGRAVNTVGLDTDKDTAASLQEKMGVETDNTGLIRLGNVSEDDIDHANEHAVAERVTGVLDDGDNVGTVGSHANQVTARTVGELDSIDSSSRSNNISDVADGGTAGRSEIEDLGTGLHEDIIKTTEDTGGQLGSEGIPHAVFDLRGCGSIAVAIGGTRSLNGNTLLSIDSFTRSQVLCDQEILLASTGNKDTAVTMGLL